MLYFLDGRKPNAATSLHPAASIPMGETDSQPAGRVPGGLRVEGTLMWVVEAACVGFFSSIWDQVRSLPHKASLEQRTNKWWCEP